MNKTINRRDFMYYFIQHTQKERLSKRTIEAQASVIILAGSKTSSVALTAAVFHILSNLQVYERLCKEVRGAFAEIEDIALQQVLLKLPYLDAVVQETLRINTPLANGFTRVIPDPKGAMICEKWVPQGVSVANLFACSCNPSTYFEQFFTSAC